MADLKSYLAAYDTIEGHFADAPEWIRTIRQSAKQDFTSAGFPTTKDEAWRFTRIRPLLQHDFQIETAYKPNGLSQTDIARYSFDDAGCHRLVFVNGNFATDLSATNGLPNGVTATSFKHALASTPDLIEKHLAKHADAKANAFVALNTAHMIDGAFVHIGKNVSVEKPIHLLFISSAGKNTSVSYPRNLLIAESGSRATVIESYVAKNSDVYFTNAVTEVVVERKADLDHYKVQKESSEAYHVATTHAYLEEESHFNTELFSMGGTFVRNDLQTYLDGERIECTLDGLYVGNGHQHIDNHTHIDHAMPHCNSYEVYKGILDDRAKAVFNGKIYVHPDAQKTDAKQSNGCMLLSDDAQINTNPQLEIFADDVKCTHGAVIGQIDENAVFYLRSRGIDKPRARQMLIYAFANEVVERVKVKALREQLESDLVQWLAKTKIGI